MGIYATVNVATGIVENMSLWDGVSEWSPGDGYIAVLADGIDNVTMGWSYSDGLFSPPPVIPPTPAEILQANQNAQSMLLYQASQAMTPVLVSLQLGDATDDETVYAKEWQAYYRALQAVDLTIESPEWPEPPTR